jgi:hypothetical protein
LVYIRPPGHFTAVKYYCGKGVKRKKKERRIKILNRG